MKDNIEFGKSDLEILLAKATTNDTNTLSNEELYKVSECVSNYEDFEVITEFLFEKLSSEPYLWRKIYKALYLIDFLLKTSEERFETYVRTHLFKIKMLESFKYLENGVEKGIGVRDKSKIIGELIKNHDLLMEEKEKAKVVRAKISGYSNSHSSYGGVSYSNFQNKNKDIEYKPQHYKYEEKPKEINFQKKIEKVEQSQNEGESDWTSKQVQLPKIELPSKKIIEKKPEINLIEMDLEDAKVGQKEEKLQGTSNIIDLLGNNIELNNPIPNNKQTIQTDWEKQSVLLNSPQVNPHVVQEDFKNNFRINQKEVKTNHADINFNDFEDFQEAKCEIKKENVQKSDIISDLKDVLDLDNLFINDNKDSKKQEKQAKKPSWK